MDKWFPSLFLDTNVLWSDKGKNIFQDKYIKWLQVYKNLTGAKIYTSEAFAQELYYLEKEKLKEICTQIKKIKSRYPDHEIIELDQDILFQTYEKQIKSLFSKIISWNTISISECIRRATEKIPPCTKIKEEFRDTVWRLSYLWVLKQKEYCVFISKDIHFSKCEKEHPSAKIYKTLYEFFKDFNEDFLNITLWETELFKVFPLSDIVNYLWYNLSHQDDVEEFIDPSGTDFTVTKTNNVQHKYTSIVCIGFEWDKYTFSFTVGFLCGFEIYDSSWKDFTEDFLSESWIIETVNGEFIYEDNKITINEESFINNVEEISLSWYLDDMAVDHYQEYGR